MSSNSGRRGSTTFDSIELEVAGLREKKPMGDAFERVALHYLRGAGSGLDEVWTWDDWPDRLRLGLKSDQGVDLVAIDGEGKRVAVQVKFHTDPGRDVTQREVATLFSLRPDLFERWFIVSNAIGHSPAAERATQGRGDVTWVHRDDLVASTIDWSDAIEAVGGKARTRVERASPRDPEQTAAIADIVKALRKHERAQLVMACGTGKTLVTRWITEAREDRLVLVLVPTLLLLKQFRMSWREHATRGFVDLGVCSDADTMGKDEWTVHPDELGVRVTTDPADIASFLKGDGDRVVFATYASSARIADAQEDPSVPVFDLVVADEAHRVAGITTKGNATERDTRVVLDADRIRSKRRLFATATPRVYGSAARGRLAEREDIEFASMDDPEHFGLEAHKLWFREAVELGRLVDYRLSVVIVTDTEVQRLIRDREIVDVQDRTFDAETLASLVALRRAVADLGLTRAISFHRTIKRARDFARELERLELDAPPVSAQHISGAMSMADRQRVLARLREPDGPTIVTNARCLTEGIDVPSLDAVAFVDPRSSAVDIVQAVGRVMRTAPEKQLGHVIVPVFLTDEELGDPEAAIESSAFAPVLAVLRALRAHDPELVSDATRIASSLGGREAVAGGHISEHIQLLGREVDIGAFEQALETRFVEVSADSWEVGLEYLRRFIDREGHARVPSSPGGRFVDGFDLAMWVVNRRAEFQRGELSADKAVTLADLPSWTWNARETRFDEGMRQVQEYAASNGHARVPHGYRSPDGYALGSWVLTQRRRYAARRLSPERAAILGALQGWAWDPGANDFIAALNALVRFEQEHGHSRVPPDFVDQNGIALGNWVDNKRNRYRRNELPKERTKEIEAAVRSWVWDPQEDDFDKGVRLLTEYAAEHGSPNVPISHVTSDGFALGRWVRKRRAAYRNGRLDVSRAARLESLDGWSWDPFEDWWREGFARLEAYVDEMGHARVPVSYRCQDGFRLGTWANSRRQEHRRDNLSPEREAALNALPGWQWKVRNHRR